MERISVFLLLIFWFRLDSASSDVIIRNRCKRVANFRQHFANYSLYGHVISNLTVPDVISCSFQCLNTQQCLSYNYKDEGVNNCELNDATVETKSRDFHRRPGYKYYDTQKGPSECVLSPCLNGGACVEMSACSFDSPIACECKLGTYGNKCQLLKDDLFNYDVIFPNKNGTANVTVTMGTTMTSFTLCLWIQTTDPGPFHIFSYLSPTGSKDLSLTCENKQYCKLLLLREYRKISLISVNDGKWRHVCLTWSSASGTWNLYLDGALRGDGRSLGTGLSIKGGGRLVLGQDQGNNSSLSLIGNITQCNLWDQVIEQPTIKNMSRYCYSNESIGDVVFWSEFQINISGQALIESHSSCNTKIKESRFILNFPLASVDNVAVMSHTMPSLAAGTICFWMKNALNNFNVFSYVAPGEVNPALEIYFGTHWRFHLGLALPRVIYNGPPVADSYWHHFCTDWNSSTTVWHIHLDGILQLTETKRHLQDYTVQGGGMFHLGQLVENGAYHSGKAFEGMLTGLNIWTETLSARAVASLAREPGTESGDLLAWSMLREGINGSVEISNTNDVELTAKESDFTLNFSTKSDRSYATVSYSSVVGLSAISACAWIKTTAWSGELTILSYSNEVHSTAIVWSIIDGKTIQTNVNAWDPRAISVSLNMSDGSWHHVCISWRRRNSVHWIYLDGEKVLDATGYKTDENIRHSGTFVLGQRQLSTGQNHFDASKAFVGEITRVNVWKQRIEHEYVRNIGKGCGLWNGNLLRWTELKSNLFGDVQVIPGSECFIPDITIQEKRNALCQKNFADPECHGLQSFSVFDFANLTSSSGRRVRCYNEEALTSSDQHYQKQYDKGKGSTCFKDMAGELMNITR